MTLSKHLSGPTVVALNGPRLHQVYISGGSMTGCGSHFSQAIVPLKAKMWGHFPVHVHFNFACPSCFFGKQRENQHPDFLTADGRIALNVTYAAISLKT